MSLEDDIRINTKNLDFTKVNIYVLQLENGKYYVGKTSKHICERYQEHMKGEGSAWTRKYRPVCVLEEFNGVTDFDEDKITKMYMSEYGIENVRGGAYCRMEMPNSLTKLLYREIWHAQNRCLECGSRVHYVSKCKSFIDEPKNTLFRIETIERNSTDWYLVLALSCLAYEVIKKLFLVPNYYY
jgi:hypothetical protein